MTCHYEYNSDLFFVVIVIVLATATSFAVVLDVVGCYSDLFQYLLSDQWCVMRTFEKRHTLLGIWKHTRTKAGILGGIVRYCTSLVIDSNRWVLGRVMQIRGELRCIKCKNGERSRNRAERKKINKKDIPKEKVVKRSKREGRNYR